MKNNQVMLTGEKFEDGWEYLFDGKRINNKLIIFNKKFGKIRLFKSINLDIVKVPDIKSMIQKMIRKNNFSSFFYFYVKDGVFEFYPDESGLTPLFFHYSKNRFVLTNDFKKIISLPNLTVSKKSIIKLLFFGFSFDGDLLFNQTSILSPDKFIRIEKKIDLIFFKNYLYNIDDTRDINSVELEKLIGDILKKAYNYNKRYQFPLSGGLDSRLLLCKYLSLKNTKPNTYSYGTGKELDSRISRDIAKKNNLKRDFFKITPKQFKNMAIEFVLFSGGATSIVESRGYGMYKKFDVDDMVINGFGLDLTLGGGAHKRKMLSHGKNSILREHILEKMCKLPISNLAKLLELEEKDIEKTIVPTINSKLKFVGNKGSLALKFDKILLNSKVPHYSIWGLNYGERYTNVFCPLFSTEFNKKLLSIRSDLRYKHRLYGDYFRNTYPDFSKFCWQKTRKNLYGEEFSQYDSLYRRIPYEIFFQTDLKSWIKKLLFSKDSKIKKYLNLDELKKLVELRGRDHSWSDFIGMVISIEILLRMAGDI